MSYKRIFSGSAGPFSGILRPRVAGLVTLRFFAKRLFPRGLWSGLFSCRLPCRVTWGSGFILSASVSRDLWLRPLFCWLPCRVARGPAFILSALCRATCGPAFFPVGFRVAWLVVRPLCHWVVVIAGATAFAAATLVAFFIAGAALWIYNPILTRLIGRK